ncbi:MAG: hypothetical protein QNJ36_11960 [Calothrix sp. MO_167.B42]|nr:hypothetical protein [Calothrix sp. MO_167.B42]
MIINTWLLVVLYIVYSLISLLLFFFTSGGWTGFVYLVVGSFVYGFGLLLLCMGGIHRSLTSKRNSVRVRGLLITALLVSQFGVLLLNRGDCGDSPCQGYLFVGKLLGDESFYNPFLATLAQFSLCVYLILLAVFVLLTLAE